MAMAMAPGLSQIVVFEGNPTNYISNDILNTMAASNMMKNLSCSWGWHGGPSNTTDNIFKTMSAQGQTFFNASGDGEPLPSARIRSTALTTNSNLTTRRPAVPTSRKSAEPPWR